MSKIKKFHAAIQFRQFTNSRWRFLWLVGCIGVFLPLSSAVFAMEAAGSPPKLAKQRALMLSVAMNIARYSTWTNLPASQTTLRFCISEGSPLAGLALQLADQMVGQRHLKIRVLTQEKSFLQACEIAFLTPKDLLAISPISIAKTGALTFSAAEDFLLLRGAVQLTKARNRLHFSVNRYALEVAGVSVSSRVLRLASEVK